MNLADAGKVLAKCTAYDNRKTTAETVKAWAEALEDMPLQDALNFVRDHYATSRDWIMPSDINHAWELLRRARQSAVPQGQRPQPPQDLDGSDYLLFRQEVVRQIGRGVSVDAARLAAYRAIDRIPPPPEITGK